MSKSKGALLATATCAVALLSSAVSAETIRLVQDEAYAPYMTMTDKAPTGIWADVITEALSRIDGDYDVVLEALPWSRAVNLVEGGQAHGLVGTYHKPDSRPWIGTYSVAPFTENVSVFCRDGVAEEGWSYPQDFKGLTFGNNAGFGTPGEEFFALVTGGLISLQEAPTTDLNLKKLAGGRIDCYVQEQRTAEMAINALGLTGITRVLDTSVEDSMIGFRGSWQGDEAAGFTSAMDGALKAMMEDGTIDRIIAETVGG
ncbi:substrate-binding periplasmic protein [Tritonibacter sp. SIMBA_163]|uniref:substrate-binding periplasmic protein n=1 Tax=Tritonibacter TaxID=2083206 RepID=UPI00398050C1